MSTFTIVSPDFIQNNPAPKVTVCVVTYNQKDFIAQCLQSLVDQVTYFSFEILVSDDCSTDQTVEILLDYRKKYPGLICLYLHKENIGALENFRFIHSQSRGKYVAHMDGDDYALPQKLQVQYDYLENHDKCQIVWHRMQILNESTGALFAQEYDGKQLASKRFLVNDLICNIAIGLHSSKMYRKWQSAEVRDLKDLDFSENVLHLNATKGYASFIENGTYGVYRINSGISRNRGYIRCLIYRWLDYFYKNDIGSKSIIASKLLLMLISDIKNKTKSFLVGLRIILKMLPKITFSEVKRVRSSKPPTSVGFGKCE